VLHILSVIAALGIRHAKCMFTSAACLALFNFSILPHKPATFSKKKKVIEHNKRSMCVDLFLQMLSEIFVIQRTERDMINNDYWSSCKVPLFCQILIKILIFSKYLTKTLIIPNSMEIRAVGAELCHADRRADGRTDAESANNACWQFCEIPYNLFSDLVLWTEIDINYLG
jgi:hypothetical protein